LQSAHRGAGDPSVAVAVDLASRFAGLSFMPALHRWDGSWDISNIGELDVAIVTVSGTGILSSRAVRGNFYRGENRGMG
jgi:hypothetical protein